MNKEIFLTKLRQSLSVLESQEQDDICAEYAQHIDMKIQKGLSEDEAIRDFGPVEQLAAEILEAYHVNPEFGRQSFSFKMPKLGTGTSRSIMQAKTRQGIVGAGNQDDNGQQAVSRLRRIAAWMKKKMAKAARGIGNAFRRFGEKCHAFTGWLRKPFAGKAGENSEETGETKTVEEIRVTGGTKTAEEIGMTGETRTTEKGAGRVTKTIGRAGRMTGRGIIMMWRGFVEFCIFCLKFMWNAAWLMFALFCGCVAMFVLAGVGAIPIFLVQGYPFKGFFIMCIGGLLCFGALAYGAFSLLIRKPKNDGSSDGSRDEEAQWEKKSDKEAAYEQTT